MKNTFILLFGISSCIAFSQVGIGTNNPRTTLDVAGDLNLRRELRVGGTTSVNGNAGTPGQILVSSGNSAVPTWKSVNTPFASAGDYQLVNTKVLFDRTGINFSANSNNTPAAYISTLGENISTNGWVQIPGLQTTILVEQEGNTLSLIFQTGVESNSGGSTIIDNRLVKYMCGVFQNDLLVAFRGDELLDVHRKDANNEGVFTLSYSVDDLPVANHVFKVACRRIQTTAGIYEFAIGRPITSSAISNAFMLQSVIKIELLEPVR